MMLAGEWTNGTAALHVASVRGRSAIVSSWARSPLSLLTPRCRGGAVWACTSNYGGGMVQGDETSLEVRVDPGARCFLGTQASTKIYRNPAGRPCSHRLSATLGEDSLLVAAPDPVQCFAEAEYEQTQVFELAASASLVLVDWISAGRIARGERWAFRRYASRNRVERAGELIWLDSLLLDEESGPMANRFRTGRFNCLATVVILGSGLEKAAADVFEAVHRRPVARQAETVITASPVGGGVLLRLAGVRIEETARAISEQLGFVPALLHGDPWSRKW